MITRRILALVVVFLSLPLGLSAQEYQPDFTQRYLWLSIKSTDTLPKQIAEAAAVGYRLVAAPYGDTDRLRLIMEKDATPPDTYEYLVFDTSRRPILMDQLDEASSRGFRVLGRTLMVYRKVVIVIMEKPPGALPAKREHRVLDTLRTSTLGKEINQAAAEGYRPLGLLFRGANHYCLLEKDAGESAKTAGQAVGPGSSPGYRLLAARSLDAVEKELKDAVQAGYRPLMSTSTGPLGMLPGQGSELLLLLEEDEGSAREYVVTHGTESSDLRQKLEHVAAGGFHLVPQTLVRKVWASATLTMLMQKAPGEPCCYQYDVLSASAKDPSSLQKQITEAAEQGFPPVGLFWKSGWTGEDIVIMEKTPLRGTPDQ